MIRKRHVAGGFLLALVGAAALAQSTFAPRSADAVCIDCHNEMEAKPILSIYRTRHGVKADRRTPDCVDCHGDSRAHAAKNLPKGTSRPPSDLPFARAADAVPEPEVAQRLAGACLKCHGADGRRHWTGSRHQAAGLACPSCHTSHAAHDPVQERSRQSEVCFKCHPDQRAQSYRLSAHAYRDGRIACVDCHNPHGTVGPALLVGDGVNDTCYTCHAEKRGPFLWAHMPVDENCANCHQSHGSTNPSLLKLRSPWLCQQCHNPRQHPSRAYSATTGTQPGIGESLNNFAQLPLRGCANCHSQVHGSNHPAGSRLLR